MKEKYYERLKRLSKDPNSSMLFWGYEASAILKEIERLNKRNNEIYEGFMATTQELCEESAKVEKLEKLNKKLCEENTRLSNGRELDQNAIDTLQDRIERLNNIINELEKYLNEQIQKSWEIEEQCYENIESKLRELKGSDKE